jgi:hypothetical protein
MTPSALTNQPEVFRTARYLQTAALVMLTVVLSSELSQAATPFSLNVVLMHFHQIGIEAEAEGDSSAHQALGAVEEHAAQLLALDVQEAHEVPASSALTSEQMEGLAKLQEFLATTSRRMPEQVLRGLAERKRETDSPAGVELFPSKPPTSTDEVQPVDPDKPEKTDKPQKPEYPVSDDPFGEKQSPGPAQVENESEEVKVVSSPLVIRVLSGDWPAIKKALAALPAEQGTAIYTILLETLAKDSGSVVLPQDVLALADAAPDTLKNHQLALLGDLVRRSLEQTEKPTDFLAALRTGTSRLGGNDPARREAAARLLLAASLVEEAAEFLPPLEPALAAKQAEVVQLHARYQALRGASLKDRLGLLRSWMLTQAVLGMPEAAEQVRAAASRRAFALATMIPPRLTDAWLKDVLSGDAAKGLDLLAGVAAQVSESFQQKEPSRRIAAIQLQSLAGQKLLAVRGAELDDSWKLALEMLTRGWINEAQKSAGPELRKIVVEDDDKTPPLDAEMLLEIAPNSTWRQALHPDTAEHVQHLTGRLAIQTENHEVALAVIRDVAKHDKKLALAIANGLINPVVDISIERSLYDDPFGSYPSSSRVPMNAHQYLSHSHWDRQQQQSGSTTRAAQLRNLAQLSRLLGTLAEAGIRPDEDSIAQAFAHCHSPAEVYREEDIQRVFGDIAKLSPETAKQLGELLRINLAGQWRNPEVQQQSGTQRTTQDQVKEVIAGYELAHRILAGAVVSAPDDVSLKTQAAGVSYDDAEFRYDQQVDLATYVGLRDTAFTTFLSAADAYARQLPKLEPTSHSVDVYWQWFQAALGTSDLGYLRASDEADRSQIERIAAAIERLGSAEDRHRELFAQSAMDSLYETPAQLKPHLIREALRVIGDHPAGQPLVEQLALYDELLDEIELHWLIDGSERVGHNRSFGVRLALRATQAVLRENGGFAEFLVAVSPQNFSQSSQQNQPDVRRNLDRELREKLSEAFHIEALDFHPSPVKPRGCNRPGWRELPLAYAVLRAKDAAIDRLPEVQLDVDCADGGDRVRLPIRTHVAVLNARDALPPPRPASDIKLRQVLDDRQLAEGRVRLEMTASARGLTPDLNQLFAEETPKVAGLQVQNIVDQGINLASLEIGEEISPQTERRWVVEYAAAGDEMPATFTFPAPIAATTAVTREKYDDADILEAGATTTLNRPLLASTKRWLWPIVGGTGLLILLTGGAMIVLKRVRRSRRPVAEKYLWPETMNPFSLLTVLKRMQADESLALSAEERRELQETVSHLDTSYFGRPAGQDAPDLETTLRRWIPRTVTTNGSATPMRPK